MNLQHRTQGRAILFTSPNGHKYTIANGNSVVLNLGNDTVLVTEVEVIGPSRYRGQAELFENSPDETIGSITLGNPVEFKESHVLGCHQD